MDSSGNEEPKNDNVVDLDTLRKAKPVERLLVRLPGMWRKDVADVLLARAQLEHQDPITTVYSAITTYDYIRNIEENGGKLLVESQDGVVRTLIWGSSVDDLSSTPNPNLPRRATLASKLGRLLGSNNNSTRT